MMILETLSNCLLKMLLICDLKSRKMFCRFGISGLVEWGVLGKRSAGLLELSYGLRGAGERRGLKCGRFG